MTVRVEAQFFGRCTYAEGLRRQQQAFDEVLVDHRPRVLGFEFDPVITLGRRAQRELDIVGDAAGFEVVRTERGGEATLHSPGQLVIYPIFHLREAEMTVRTFVDLLLKTTQRALGRMGVATDLRCQEPGVFTNEGKIAFLGLRISQGISTHGIAVNLRNDPSLFETIRSCGVQKAQIDSLLQRQVMVTEADFFQVWVEEFAGLTKPHWPR